MESLGISNEEINSYLKECQRLKEVYFDPEINSKDRIEAYFKREKMKKDFIYRITQEVNR